jgi:hypothetical protein
VIDCFKGEKSDFEVYSFFHRKKMDLFEIGFDMFSPFQVENENYC